MKIEKLSNLNFHAWKQKISVILALRDLDQYIERELLKYDDSKKEWNRRDKKHGL